MSDITIARETPRTPFGLPTGSVRGIISTLICAFFWVVLCWPHSGEIQVVLAHFFLLGMVLMAFASNPLDREGEGMAFLPWLLRLIFVGGSIAAIVYAWTNDGALLAKRLTPNAAEVETWWIYFLACTAGGFSTGLLLRYLLGKSNPIFGTLRAWLSVLAMILLAVEIILIIASFGTGNTYDFLHIYNCFELAIVAAYFGSRA